MYLLIFCEVDSDILSEAIRLNCDGMRLENKSGVGMSI